MSEKLEDESGKTGTTATSPVPWLSTFKGKVRGEGQATQLWYQENDRISQHPPDLTLPRTERNTFKIKFGFL